MGQLKGVYALWYREYKVFIREKSRVIASIVNPILWFLVIGGGIGSAVSISGVNYQTFIFPGVLIQSILFSSIFFGVYIVWDKKIDFLKEVLVSPLSRTAIFMGKVAGGATDTLIQIVILLIVGYAFAYMGLMPGIRLDPVNLMISMVFILITIVAAVSIGLIMGSQMESPEGFQLVSSFVIFPMFFLSGAFFPIDNLPAYLSPFVYINPVTYSVDGIRAALIGTSVFPMALDLAVITVFAAAMIVVGTHAFKKMKL
ncbi:MAG: ABC transporter permease [Candidatus Altiarchaeia archaeon]|jgi:ABC-2 type transport system permease protein